MKKKSIISEGVSNYLFAPNLKSKEENIDIHRIFKFIQNKQTIDESFIIDNNGIRYKAKD